MTRRIVLLCVLAAVAGCAVADPTEQAAPRSPSSNSPPTAAGGSRRDDRHGHDAAPGAEVDAHDPPPLSDRRLVPATLGATFETGPALLPAETMAAVTTAGGETLDPEAGLTLFGAFGIVRPSGPAALMNVSVTGSSLPDATVLSTEVSYLVTSDRALSDLVQAAAVAAGLVPGRFVAEPGLDDSVGSPDCGQTTLDAGGGVVMEIGGCEYRTADLASVRALAVGRFNYVTDGPVPLPDVIATAFPTVLSRVGRVESFTARFGPPNGAAGATVELQVRLHLDGDLPGLGGRWAPDGPGRWWSDQATITRDRTLVVWTKRTRIEDL